MHLLIDKKRFESTNALWNELRLNDPWSIGYVSTLIEKHSFQSAEEWEAYYYRSGQKREKRLSTLDLQIQQMLNDEQLIKHSPRKIHELPTLLKKLNYNYGRSINRLSEKGEILYANAIKRHIDITVEECMEAVRYRTIGQTWNGIMLREKNVISYLKENYPQLTFTSTDGAFDHRFAIDYEVRYRTQLICGLQIKPTSYQGKAPYIQRAKRANHKKHQHYVARYGKPVVTIMAERNGKIINHESVRAIRQIVDSI